MDDYPLSLLVAQIVITFALFGATSWYAYYTMKLARQQRRNYLLNEEIWKRQSTPRIWFYIARPVTTKIRLTAINLGGDVAIDVISTIVTNIGKFVWKWLCILPKDPVHVDLPDEISYAGNFDNIGNFRIECEYSDSSSRHHKTTQTIELKLLKDRIATISQDSSEIDDQPKTKESESKTREMKSRGK